MCAEYMLTCYLDWGRGHYFRESFFAERIGELDDDTLEEKAGEWRKLLEAQPDSGQRAEEKKDKGKGRARQDVSTSAPLTIFDSTTNELIDSDIITVMVEQFRSAIVDGVRYDPTEFKGENLGEPGVEGSGGVKPTLDEKELCNRHGMAMSSVLHFLSRVFKRPEKTISKFCNLETLGFRQESPWQLCLQVYERIICEDNEDFGMYRYTQVELMLT